jgi:hypothetical protein
MAGVSAWVAFASPGADAGRFPRTRRKLAALSAAECPNGAPEQCSEPFKFLLWRRSFHPHPELVYKSER